MGDDYNFFQDYSKWLIRQVRGRRYTILLRLLHDTEFQWTLMPDEHRESDGRNLRRVFAEEMGCDISNSDLNYPASFLEVVISLARAMDDCILNRPDDYPTGPWTWFWEMMENCGLAAFDNDTAREFPGGTLKTVVNDICMRVMLRLYGRDGEGGLFPIPNSPKDQRKIELWYQMNEYILATGRA